MNHARWPLALLAATLITPATGWAQQCNLSLSPAQIDFGQLNRTTLQASSGRLPLPVRRLTLNLLCETEQELAITYHGRRSASGLALGEHGAYRLRLLQATVEDKTVQWTQARGVIAADAQPTADLDGDAPIRPVREGGIVRGKRLSAQVELQASLEPVVLATADARIWQAEGRFQIAGEHHDLQVRVGFAPAACLPRLAGQGRVDFGRIAVGELRRDGVTSFSRQTTLEVACDAPTRFAIRAVDNRAGTASDRLGARALFGIGRTAAGQALGGFTVRVGKAIGQAGTTASAVVGDLSAQVWKHADQAMLQPSGEPLAFDRDTSSGLAPDAWSGLSIPLGIDLHLAPAAGLDLHQETAIDGSATLEILYL